MLAAGPTSTPARVASGAKNGRQAIPDPPFKSERLDSGRTTGHGRD